METIDWVLALVILADILILLVLLGIRR